MLSGVEVEGDFCPGEMAPIAVFSYALGAISTVTEAPSFNLISQFLCWLESLLHRQILIRMHVYIYL